MLNLFGLGSSKNSHYPKDLKAIKKKPENVIMAGYMSDDIIIELIKVPRYYFFQAMKKQKELLFCSSAFTPSSSS